MPNLSRDALRIFLLMVVTGLTLYLIDPANAVVYQAVIIVLFQVGSAYITRLILFPHLDLQGIAKAAINRNNISAAIVFTAIIAFLIAVMFLSTQVLR